MSMSNTETHESSYREEMSGDSECEEVTGPLHVKPLNVRSPRRPSQEARQPHGRLSYPNMMDLKDTDGELFYALEDQDMIRWIGREKFMEVLTAYPNGWVKGLYGGDKGTLRLYKCSMKYTRYSAKCVYTEPEYEHLSLEAHLQSKRPYLTQQFNSGSRPPFFCIYCKDDFKDKNCLSWHRVRSVCPQYNGQKPLKMYPTWTKSDASELRRITKKFPTASEPKKRPPQEEDSGHAKKAKHTIEDRPSSQRDRRSNSKFTPNEREAPQRDAPTHANRQNVGGKDKVKDMKEVHQVPATRGDMRDKSTRVATEHGNVKAKRTTVSTPDYPVKDTTTDASAESSDSLDRRGHARNRARSDRPAVTVDVGGPLEGQGRGRQLSSGSLQQQKINLVPKTRLGVEAAANVKANAFTLEGHVGLRPRPHPMPWIGLYVLMHETGVVVERSLLADPEATMQRLLAMDADNTLLSKLKTAFGHWYITSTPEELKPVERTDALTREITRSLKTFERQGKEDPEVPLYEEIKRLGAYLTHQKEMDAYEAERTDAKANLDALRKNSE